MIGCLTRTFEWKARNYHYGVEFYHTNKSVGRSSIPFHSRPVIKEHFSLWKTTNT